METLSIWKSRSGLIKQAHSTEMKHRERQSRESSQEAICMFFARNDVDLNYSNMNVSKNTKLGSLESIHCNFT
jgi:hypothetical protein